MIYSKRRKNMGGGRRKRSGRKSYMSKRTKRTTLTRIKQRGGEDCPPLNVNRCLSKKDLISINAKAAEAVSSRSSIIEYQHTYIYTTKNSDIDDLFRKLRIKDKDTSYECCSVFNYSSGEQEKKYIIKTKARKDFIKFLEKNSKSGWKDINNIPDKTEERDKLIEKLEEKEKVMFLALSPDKQFAMILKLVNDPDERKHMISYLDNPELKIQMQSYYNEYVNIVKLIGNVDAETKQTNLLELTQYLSTSEIVKILLLLDRNAQDDIFSYLGTSITKYIRLYLECSSMISKLRDLYLKDVKATETLNFDLYVEYFTIANKVDQLKIVMTAYHTLMKKSHLIHDQKNVLKTKQDDILSHLNPEITKYIRLYLAFSITISKQPKSELKEEKKEKYTEDQITELYLDYDSIEVKVTGSSSAPLFLQQSKIVEMLSKFDKTDQDTVLSYLNPDVSEIIGTYLAEQLAINGDKK